MELTGSHINMAINNAGDIYTEVLVRNNRTTTDSFITDTMLQDWLREAHTWACACYKWPITEGRASTTFASLSTGEDGWLTGTFPEGWKSDSIRLMTIDGKRVDKKNFYKFQQFLEDNSADTSRIFTDRARVYYVNPNIDLNGTVTVWGQYTPAIDPTDLTATTIFSGMDEEANEAIIEKMSCYLKRREHIPDEAELHDQRAKAKLDEVWQRVKDEQFQYQDTDNDGMFTRFDAVNGGFRDDILKRDQFGW